MSWADVLAALTSGAGAGLTAYGQYKSEEREREERAAERAAEEALRKEQMRVQREQYGNQLLAQMAGLGFTPVSGDAVPSSSRAEPAAKMAPVSDRAARVIPAPEVEEGGRMSGGAMVAPGNTKAVRTVREAAPAALIGQPPPTEPAAPMARPRVTPTQREPVTDPNEALSFLRSNLVGGMSVLGDTYGGMGLSGLSDVRPRVEIGGRIFERPSPMEEAIEELAQQEAMSAMRGRESVQKMALENAQAYVTGMQMYPEIFEGVQFDPMVDYKEIYDRESEARAAIAEVGGTISKELADRTRANRNDYMAQNKDEITRAVFLKATVEAANRALQLDPDAEEGAQRASDISLLYNFITALDPGSVVREGETLLVQRSASIPDRFIQLVQQANEGGLMSPGMRRSIRAEAISRARGQASVMQETNRRQIDYLNAVGVNPSLVVFDPYDWLEEYGGNRDILDEY